MASAEQPPLPDPDFDSLLSDTIEKHQMRVAQATGQVPRVPIVRGPDGQLHDLVEEEVRKLQDNEGEN